MPLILPSNSISAVGYEVDNSLRFDDGSGDELTRSQSSSPSSQRLFTFSAWVKRGNLNSGVSDPNMQFFSQHNDTTDRMDFRFQSGDTIDFRNNTPRCRITTNRLFRDVSAWYHVVLRVDTTQSTASNRIRLYINGVQETSFSTEDYGDQNDDLITNASTFDVGDDSFGTAHFDGYMCEVVYCDGQSLDPTSFGEFDEDTGIWKPIDVSGLTFGTNGFYLDFENSGSLGADVSGNGNNFTVNNLTSIDQTTDTCTNNFATLNPLMNNWTSISNGNLTVSNTTQAFRNTLSTIAVTSGKWYCEVKIDLEVGGTYPVVGIADVSEFGYPTQNNLLDTSTNGYGFYMDGNYYNNGSNLGTWGNATTGDIVGFALDLDSGTKTIKAYLNGTLGATQTINNPISAYAFGCSTFQEDGVGCSWNFGNPPFTISSGNSDGNGMGNFEYAVPSGYFALCTSNLAEHG